MVSAVLLLRIKQAEFAIRGGRLEEAYQRVQQPAVREHRRGQELAQQLADSFVSRGRSYLDKGQFDAAAIDCQRAADLAGQQELILELRREIESAARNHARRRRHQEGVADQVRSMIRHGDFEGGQQKLDDLSSSTGERAGLAQEIERKQTQFAAALQRAKRTIEASDDEQALAALLAAERLRPDDNELATLRGRYVEAMLGKLRQAIADGRLDQATRQLERLRPLSAGHDGIIETESFVARLRNASQALAHGDLAEVSRLLKQATQIMSSTAWLTAATADASAAATAIEALRAGPLGLVQSGGDLSVTSPYQAVNPMRAADLEHGAAVVPERFLIQADGVGSFLVVRKDSTMLGPARSSRAPDVELQGMKHKSNVRIDRVDEDYFLRSEHELNVNNQPKREALLADGDVIELGKRCRGTFRLPNATTSTAVLEFNGSSFPRRDVRGVLLLSDAILVGSDRSAHIRVPQAKHPAVLYLRGETLSCRGREHTVPITFGESFAVGETSLVCTEV